MLASWSPWSMAYCWTTPPPLDQPAMWMRPLPDQPRASTRAWRSSLQSRSPRVASTGLRSVRPKARRSGATSRWPSGKPSARSRQNRPMVMLPWTSSTGTPSSGPLTQQWVPMRLVSTITLSMTASFAVVARKVVLPGRRRGAVALEVEVEAGEAGFDAGRLARIDRHFAGYVEDGRLPGWLVLVSRRGRIVHLATCGRRDLEADLPVELDTRFRIYSMTKPVTAVAAMQLYEQGAFALKDPVSAFIPSFAEMAVYRDGPASAPRTEPATRPMLLWHLLTHTAGLTYGFHHAHPVDAMYRAAGFEWVPRPGADLAECCELWAGLPLLFEPGAEWNYSVASDVLGRVVEVVSGQPLDRYFAERIFEPLGMDDTGFWVEGEAAGELAALYAAGPDGGRAVRFDQLGSRALSRPACLDGGGGLVSTAADYHRFTQALLGGGELDGARLL